MHVIPKLILVPLNVHTLTVLIYTSKWYPLKDVKLLDSGNSLSVWWVEELRRGLMQLHAWLFPSRLSWERREVRGVMGRRKGEGICQSSLPFPPSNHPLALLSFLKRDDWGRVRLHACSATSCLFVSILRCNWKPKNKAVWLKKAKTQVSCVR